MAFEMHLDEDELIDRLINRRYCPKCGRIYNYKTNPPKNNNICDFDKEKLLRRNDDTEEVIRKRLNIYEEETRPLVNYYRSLGIYRKVNAQGGQEDVFARISHIVDDYLNIKCRSN
jgi:adenylate kinase